MNEAETRAELIDPKLKACGWGVVEGSKILRERNVCKITEGRVQVGGRKKPLIADYILVYKGIKLAVVEAKSNEQEVGEGVAQAKQYAAKLNLETTYSTNAFQILNGMANRLKRMIVLCAENALVSARKKHHSPVENADKDPVSA